MKTANVLFWLITITIISLFFFLLAKLAYNNAVSHQRVVYKDNGANHQGQCGVNCKALDPVMDPLYNIKDVIENAVLLEEHLIDDKKYCIDCVCKHFLLITGLLSEAVWLAGTKVDLYPKLKEHVVWYNMMFRYWLDNRDNDTIRLEVAEKLRKRRKELINTYILNEKEIRKNVGITY